MSPSRISGTALGMFACAVFLLEQWQIPSYPVFLWVTCTLLCFVTGAMMLLRIRFAEYVFVTTASIALAFAVVSHAAHETSEKTVEFYVTNEAITLVGFITDEPDRRPMLTKYTLNVDTVILPDGKEIKSIQGKTLVTDRNRKNTFSYGDRIMAYGQLQHPAPVEDFRYDNYLSRYGIYSILEARSMRESTDFCADSTMTTTVRRGLYTWKEQIENRINLLLPEPHASFMAGLLTGSRKGIPDELMKDFATTGLTHIIAISGYNITMVTAIIMGMLFWLPLRWRFAPAVLAITAFTIFVGASAAVVRAALMGILGLLAMHCGRVRDMRLALLWTLAIMIAWNPRYLWYDAGFQLSFLSVVGLLELSPYLGKHLKMVPEFLGIRDSLQATIAAQIATLPLSVALFGRISLIAPIANVLVAPLIPLSMLLGTLALALSVIIPPLGKVIAACGWVTLQWIILVSHICAKIPFAALTTKSDWQMYAAVSITAVVALLAMRHMIRNQTERAGHS